MPSTPASPELQRRLYDAYRLRVRDDRTRNAATLQITNTADGLPSLKAPARAAADGKPAPGDLALVLCPPGGASKSRATSEPAADQRVLQLNATARL
jgi:hypothetical protein